ncbi:hypothetical protein F5Y11DRAFT_350635 [Daldinia sp. FL1419]|nr:hypothetical protein F5Y11DRAFT_350635 [Daldinia sp. FL1419]
MKGIVALLLLGLAVAAPVSQELQNELPNEDAKTRPHPTGLPTVSFSFPPLPTWSLPPLPTGSDFPGFPRPTGQPGGPGGFPRPTGRPQPTGRPKPTGRPHPTGRPQPTSRPHPTGRPGRPTTKSPKPTPTPTP